MPNLHQSASIISIHEAAAILGVADKTLRRWEDSGVLVPMRSEGGHRRYKRHDIEKFAKERAKNKQSNTLTAKIGISDNSAINQAEMDSVQNSGTPVIPNGALIPSGAVIPSVSEGSGPEIIPPALSPIKAPEGYVSAVADTAPVIADSDPQSRVLSSFGNGSRIRSGMTSAGVYPQLYHSLAPAQQQFLRRAKYVFIAILALFMLAKGAAFAAPVLQQLAERSGLAGAVENSIAKLPAPAQRFIAFAGSVIPSVTRNLDPSHSFGMTATDQQTIAEVGTTGQVIAGDSRVKPENDGDIPGKVLGATIAQDNVVFEMNVPSNFGGAATFQQGITTLSDVSVGGNAVISGNETVKGNLIFNSGNLTSTATVFNIGATGPTTINLGAAAGGAGVGTINLGSNNSTVTANNNFTVKGLFTAAQNVQINGVQYAFPSGQGGGNTFLRNDGGGTLTWKALQFSDLGGIVPFSAGGTNNSVNYAAGSVIFSDGSKLTENNANFFWDNGNARLGIGTNAPVGALSVGAGSAFSINSAGAITAATGYTQGSGNFTLSGASTAVNISGATAALNISGASSTVTVKSLASGGAGVLYTDTTGKFFTTLSGASGYCLLSSGSSAPVWASCSGASGSQFQALNGAIVQYNSTQDVLFGGQATTSAKFAFANVNSGVPVASISAGAAGATYLTADGNLVTTNNQTLTIGDHGTTGDVNIIAGGNVGIGTTNPSSFFTVGTTTQFQVNSAGAIVAASSLTSSGAITFNALHTAGAVLYSDAGGGVNDTAQGTAGFCLLSGGSGAPTWASCAGSSGATFQTLNGAIVPYNSTTDFLVGGQSSASAKFAFMNVLNGAPTASIAGSVAGNALAMTGDGTITTTLNRSLQLNPTGGNVGVGTSNPLGLLSVGSSSQFQVSGTGAITSAALNTAGGVVYTNANGLLGTVAGGLGTCLISGGTGAPTWSSCAGSAGSTFQALNGAIIPYNSTQDFLLGGQSTASAKFAVLAMNTGTPVASVSSGLNGTAAYLAADGTLGTANKMTLTLGGTNTGNIVINPGAANGTLTLANLTTQGGLLYTANTNGLVNDTGAGSIGQCLVSNGSGAPQWVNCSSAGTASPNLWRLMNAAFSPVNDTGDLLIGSSASSSAKFGFLNVNSGTPTASVSSGLSGTAAYLTADGTLAAANKMNLTLGNSATYATTGNVLINPSGVGNVGIGTSSPAQKLDVTGVIQANSGSTNYIRIMHDGANPYLSFGGGNGLFIQSATTMSTLFNNDGSVQFGWNSANNSGNVEILRGTGANLRLYGVGGGTGNLGSIIFGNGNYSDTGAKISSYTTSGTADDGDLRFSTAKNIASGGSMTEWMRITSSGLIGIGTTNPQTLLDIRGSGTPVASISAGTAGAAYLTAAGKLGTTSLQSLTLGDSVTTGNVIILPSGNVGVGTNSPSSFFSVGATTQFQVNSSGALIAATGLTSSGSITFSSQHTAGSVLTSDGAGVVTDTAQGVANQCLISNGASAPSWAACAAGTSAQNLWNSGSGAIFPLNSTMDLLFGGQATTSAKFAFLNANTGTPVASMSTGLSGTAAYLTAGGVLSTANNMSLQLNPTGGNVGVGTTAPISKLDVQGGQLNVSGGATVSATYGGGTALGVNTNTLSTGIGLDVTSTSTALTTGGLGVFDWSPGSATTATGDLLSLNVGANGTIGNIFNVKNNGSSVFSVSQSQITAALPVAVTAPGDIADAYDLTFTNPTASFIKSTAPLTLQAGEVFNSSNLQLTTFNSGQIVLDAAGGVTLNQAQAWNLVTAVNSLNIGGGLLSLDTTNMRHGINTTAPLAALDVKLANSTTVPVASFSGQSTSANLVVDQSGTGDIFTASVSGLSKFTIAKNGGTEIGSYATNTTLPPANGLVVSGLVGINTISPVAQLEVNGDLRAATATISAVAGGKGLVIKAATVQNDNLLELTDATATPLSVFDKAGNLGVGKTAPAFKLDVTDSQAATAAAMITNSNTGIGTSGLAIKLGFTGTGATTNYFQTYLDGLGRINGKVQSNGANGITYATNGIDLAEYFTKDDPTAVLAEGTLVCQGKNGVRACVAGDTSNVIGIISAHPAFLGGSAGPNKVVVALQGQVPLRVNGANGAILSGDAIAAVIPSAVEGSQAGVGAKQVRAGSIVGKALADFFPDPANPTAEGMIMVNVQPGYNDPDAYLASSDAAGYGIAQDAALNFVLKTPAGAIVDRVLTASSAVVANLRAGAITAQSVAAQTIKTDSLRAGTVNATTLQVQAVSIGSMSLDQYIGQVVAQLQTQASSSAALANGPASIGSTSGNSSSTSGTATGSATLASAPTTLGTTATSAAQLTSANSATLLEQSFSQIKLSSLDTKIVVAASEIGQYADIKGSAFVGGDLGVGRSLVLGQGLQLTDQGLNFTAAVPAAARHFSFLSGLLSLDAQGGVTITGDLTVNGRILVGDKDAAGLAKVLAGDTEVRVSFARPFAATPIITVNADDSDTRFTVGEKSSTGFVIRLKPLFGATSAVATQDLQFTWTAVNVVNARTFLSPSATQSGNLSVGLASGSGVVAGGTGQ